MTTHGRQSAPGHWLCSRRQFWQATSGVLLAPGWIAASALAGPKEPRVVLHGPGAQYVPRVWAAFVRRPGDYGILWPGAIYDGEAALRDYRHQLEAAAAELGITVRLRPAPIYSLAEAEAWLAEAKADAPDGLFLVLLDRQQHAWPTAGKAVDTKIPTVVFAPVGTAFTTNTAPVANKDGVFICSTSDFQPARYGLKMLKAGAKLREMRFLVIKGDQRSETRIKGLGTRLLYLPTRVFLDRYNEMPVTEEVKGLAANYLKAATRIAGPSREDLYNGIKSFVVARQLLEQEAGDGITMDCLGALGRTKVSLPCIAWSKLLDVGVPAACEADLGAAVTHALVQYLFDRPGFQQDPVPETARECLIGAHCTCPTRLNGFDRAPEPYDLSHHHGKRDAVPRPVWRKGQRVTVADVVLSPGEELTSPGSAGRSQMIISTGTVVANVAVPPAGGCVVSVMVKLDTQPDLLTYPGFHQLFFYGDFKRELLAYCKLFNFQPVVA